MDYPSLSNAELLEAVQDLTASNQAKAEHIEQLKKEHEAAMQEAEQDYLSEDAERSRASEELGRRMILHKVRSIRDWRGEFVLRGAAEGKAPEVWYLPGDNGAVSWMDWIILKTNPEATPPFRQGPSLKTDTTQIGKVVEMVANP